METRRTVLKYLTGAMGASACGLDALESLARQLNGQSKKPNIVCIVGEGLRWDEMSSTGNKLVQDAQPRPHWTAGLYLSQCVCRQCAVPAVARPADGNVFAYHGGGLERGGQDSGSVSAGHRPLQKAGYETAFLGKSHVEGALMDHYWDYYFGFVGQADYYRPRITEGVRGEVRPGRNSTKASTLIRC